MNMSQLFGLVREALNPGQNVPVDEKRHVRLVQGIVECPCCGHYQHLSELKPGTQARCCRCGQLLDRRNRTSPIATPLAFCISSASLYLAMLLSTLMMLDLYGRERTVDILTGPIELLHEGWGEIGVLVAIATIIVPGLVISMMMLVLVGALQPKLPFWVPHLLKWYERLRPWSMVEVYILGVFVAYTKLSDMAYVQVGAAVFLVASLMVTMSATDATLDTELIWRRRQTDTSLRRMDNQRVRLTCEEIGPDDQIPPASHMVSCLSCSAVLVFDEKLDQTAPLGFCPRCGHVLRQRKPDSIARTVALLVSAVVFYLPANIYPVMTVIRLGAGTGHTIVEGAIELWESNMIPLSLLVLFASVLVPVLKIIGLLFMVISTKCHSARNLPARSRLYRLVDVIGRWSMIDVFMVSILVAMVRFSSMASISANGGVVCFAAVVVLTIFAVHAFDPRLMWDAAGKNGDTAPADAGQNCPAKIEAAAYWDNMEPDRA
ncbi:MULTISPECIES: paraquat-inducible protein A [Acetobacter]|uniref:Paraquat-inducible protein A n=1 Tax=Acetobacter pomorum DM001 TaxID=945681 RepID=F1YR41_9PROT|nr:MULTISPECIES: paraquat-inducible protein A [Acetobacter]ATI12482.1 paraquat-inducible protein A [Acetobacter pomorum]AXC27380.1 paraquat-inducible protein A [Acetobacter sp. JWB]EGE48772.1 Paraquat-inducible protein A [Acetobacter pomorum DM001]KAA8424363.1 paraquat-inducible protein A [Acetobacter pomorum]KAA8431610.1 paraquat-inducible protein A [Acetobacter pomorum]